jgi:acyl carrier protein
MAPSRVLVVADGTELAGDLGYDSLRLMELGIALERAFDLTWLDPGQLAGVRTVADVVGLISTARDGAVR